MADVKILGKSILGGEWLETIKLIREVEAVTVQPGDDVHAQGKAAQLPQAETETPPIPQAPDADKGTSDKNRAGQAPDRPTPNA